jgi:hypothetical protein
MCALLGLYLLLHFGTQQGCSRLRVSLIQAKPRALLSFTSVVCVLLLLLLPLPQCVRPPGGLLGSRGISRGRR